MRRMKSSVAVNCPENFSSRAANAHKSRFIAAVSVEEQRKSVSSTQVAASLIHIYGKEEKEDQLTNPGPYK